MSSLKDSLPLIRQHNEEMERSWVVKKLARRKDPLAITFNAPGDLQLKVTPQRCRASDVFQIKAKKFTALLKKGVRPGAAAHALHTSVRKLMSRTETQALVRELIENNTFDAKVRALLARAITNKILLEATATGDTKTVTDMLKIIGDDSEVGMKNGPATTISIGIDSALAALLDRTIPLPELAPAAAPPLDVECEDIPTP